MLSSFNFFEIPCACSPVSYHNLDVTYHVQSVVISLHGVIDASSSTVSAGLWVMLQKGNDFVLILALPFGGSRQFSIIGLGTCCSQFGNPVHLGILRKWIYGKSLIKLSTGSFSFSCSSLMIHGLVVKRMRLPILAGITHDDDLSERQFWFK